MAYTYKVLTKEAVQSRWPEIRELLARAVAHGRGEIETDDILRLTQTGAMGVFALEDGDEIVAATAFEVIRYPRRKVLNFAFTGGRDAAAIAANYDKIEAVARQMGADAVMCYCRPAVARRIKRLIPGAEQTYVAIEKRVTR